MFRLRGRQNIFLTVILFGLTLFYLGLPQRASVAPFLQTDPDLLNSPWARRPLQHEPTHIRLLPQGRERKLPRIQHEFDVESTTQKELRLSRQKTIRDAFNHTWTGYCKYAWLADELRPLSGGTRTSFGNWSATLVDSLDTLWIMDFKDEFAEAVNAVAAIDFESTTYGTISLFETTIRYLGGLLAAYDLSGDQTLLKKAVQLGTLLYTAFDTPTRLPSPFFNPQSALDGYEQHASYHTPSADIASLSLEFTRLSQLTGDPKFFDAIQRIGDLLYQQQDNSQIPGLWPIYLNAADEDFASGYEFTLNGMADSAYEYIPKMNLLLGGQMPEYAQMYSKFISPVKEHMFYRPMTKNDDDILLSGFLNAYDGNVSLVTSGTHLGCFIGGMVAVGAKTIGPISDVETATKLADGCFWAYNSTLSGIMPETFAAAKCASKESCPWNETAWHEAVAIQRGFATNESVVDLIQSNKLPPGFTQFIDERYLLRPEAIESLFILYRVTGDTAWQDKAWKMWQAIDKAARTEIAYAQLDGVGQGSPRQVDQMESFWSAETLKYFYLIFSEPGLINLDEWVLNTEAHPFRRPKSRSWFG